MCHEQWKQPVEGIELSRPLKKCSMGYQQGRDFEPLSAKSCKERILILPLGKLEQFNCELLTKWCESYDSHVSKLEVSQGTV